MAARVALKIFTTTQNEEAIAIFLAASNYCWPAAHNTACNMLCPHPLIVLIAVLVLLLCKSLINMILHQ